MMAPGHFYVCLSTLSYVNDLKGADIKWYWGFPVTSYYELNALVDMGACEIKLGAPLFFDLPTVKKMCNLPLRIVPNVAYSDGLERIDGVCGTWVRPEDMDAYAEYIGAVEFEDCDLRKERAMYRIYAEDKAWPTDLGLLITNLNHTGTNRMIRSDASQQRISCGQRCQEGNGCRLCYRMLDVANPGMVRDYLNRE
jgi:hypothetical protein